MSIKLTVCFEEPFWVGIFERTFNKAYEIAKVTFGAEPKDYEIYEFIITNFYKLKFSKPVSLEKVNEKKVNPKRLQKKIKRETEFKGIGTKAQEVIKLEQESKKKQRKIFSKVMREAEKKKQFELKVQKKKEKKKGH